MKATLTRVYFLFILHFSGLHMNLVQHYWSHGQVTGWYAAKKRKKVTPHPCRVCSISLEENLVKYLTILLAWIHFCKLWADDLLCYQILFSVLCIQKEWRLFCVFVGACTFLLSWTLLIAWYNLVWINF